MLVDLPLISTPFADVAQAEVFLTFLGEEQVFGMKVRSTTNVDAILHMAPHEPKLVDPVHFRNRDLFVLRGASFRFPEIKHAMAGSPDTYAYGAAMLSGEGVFLRAAHANGPFDVELSAGIARLSQNHPGAIWFDTWEVIGRSGTDEYAFFSRQQSTGR